MSQVVIFSFSGQDGIADAQEICCLAEAIGFSPVLISYFDDYQSTSDISQRVYSLSHDIASAPPISTVEFFIDNGFELDFSDLFAHNISVDEGYLEHLVYDAKFTCHLRGMYKLIKEKISFFEPELVVIPQGADVVSRLTARACFESKTPYMFSESGFFRNFIFLDILSPHFFRGETSGDIAWKTKTSDLDLYYSRLGSAFIKRWMSQSESKYAQETNHEELSKLDHWLKSDDRPVLLVPGQLENDANVVISLGKYTSLIEMVQTAIASAGKEWKVIYKKHPYDHSNKPETFLADDVFVVDNISILKLLPLVNAVATHSSNVGLEALIYGIPVITWGNPIYSGKNISLDAYDPALCGGYLNNIQLPCQRNVYILIGLLISTALIGRGNAREFRKRINRARSIEPVSRIHHYGSRIKNLIEDVGTFLSQVRADEILACQKKLKSILDYHSVPSSQSLSTRIYLRMMRPSEYLVKLLPDLSRNADGLQAYSKVSESPFICANNISPSKITSLCLAGKSFFVWIGSEQYPSKSKSPCYQVRAYEGLLKYTQQINCTYGAVLVDVGRKNHCGAFFDLQSSGFSKLLARQMKSSNNLILYEDIVLPWQIFEFKDPVNIYSTCVPISLASGGHLIYGPNYAVPAGDWIVEYKIDFVEDITKSVFIENDNISILTLDIYSSELGIVASRTVGRSRGGRMSIPFHLDVLGCLEFRVFSHRFEALSIVFEGVLLVDQSGMQ